MSAPVADLQIVQNDALSPLEVNLDRCLPFIKASVGEGPDTIESVGVAILSGKAQLWPGQNCALVSEVEHAPGRRFARVWHAGGDMDELVAMTPGLESWARMQGCDSVVVSGRKGWERIMKALGYEFESVVLRKPL
jgi:hypothetical protein